MQLHGSVVWTSQPAVSPVPFSLGAYGNLRNQLLDLHCPAPANLSPPRPASVTEMEMDAVNLDDPSPSSLDNPLPRALVPIASLPSSTHPIGKEPLHGQGPPRKGTATLDSSWEQKSRCFFAHIVTYFSHIWGRSALKDQLVVHLLAWSRCFPSPSANVGFCENGLLGSLPPQEPTPITSGSPWDLCLWLAFRRIPISCPQHPLSGIVLLSWDWCCFFLPGGGYNYR